MFAQLLPLSDERSLIFAPKFAHPLQKREEARSTFPIISREETSGKEGLEIGAKKDRERPTASSAERDAGALKTEVKIGSFVLVDFDANEVGVHYFCDCRGGEALAEHSLAVMATGASQTDEKRSSLLLREPLGLCSPGEPIDQGLRMGQEMRADLVAEIMLLRRHGPGVSAWDAVWRAISFQLGRERIGVSNALFLPWPGSSLSGL
jgi:hypothetical protein